MNCEGSLSSLFGSCVVSEETVWDAIKRTSTDPSREPSCFYHLSIDEVVRRVKLWRLKLPRVEPHYAVKCNDHDAVLNTLAVLGTGFDCASKAEMNKVLSMGVEPSRIIFAHPCKIASHLRHAKACGVSRMTFDSKHELIKIQKLFPAAELLIRIRCDAESAQCQLGMKFGVNPEEARPLLAFAAQLKLNVVGVAFHVGSGCSEPSVFLRAIKASKQVFIEASEEGHSPSLLDLGGGFMGGEQDTLEDAARYINTALDEHFPEGCGVRIIAEPGRFMVASAFTLATPIINKRDVTIAAADLPADVAPLAADTAKHVDTSMYFIDDGVYGSFNCVLYDHQVVKPFPLLDTYSSDRSISSVWGPTCDGFDQVISGMMLPSELAVGDWLVWHEMGAYTIAAAGNFNGFDLPSVLVHLHDHTRIYLENLLEINAKTVDTSDCSSGVGSEDEWSSIDGISRPMTPRNPEMSSAGDIMLNFSAKLASNMSMNSTVRLLQAPSDEDKDLITAVVNFLFAPSKDQEDVVLDQPVCEGVLCEPAENTER